MARMLGASTRWRVCWCRDCRPTRSAHLPEKRARRSREDQDVRAYVSRLWAEDWDSAEDAVYDEMEVPPSAVG